MNNIQIMCSEIIKQFREVEQQREELEDRIYKAIEYIDTHAYSNVTNNYDELYDGQIEDLIDILKGVDKE